ncbi:roadblock/LC7 domain-containing protein [Calidithermus roseus]|uniref:Roadblock/LC7 domain protein n=1 Tax=Calidithermus roseus TaxID=1644118 RepID=A0A399F4T1_9DEIN|nr:roadblock/LC7 domain-containing protein [Calidithermus roseus]RIH89621.1 Roadblock/LC7 domain protein [Calidithermus roseus]
MKMLNSLVPLGIRRAVLTGTDGLVIESVGRGGPSPEVLAVELANLTRAMGNTARQLGGELRRFTLATDDQEILAVVFEGYCLGVLLERGTDRKSVGNELTRLALRLAEEI